MCLEPVLAKGKQFGVLDGCDHTFCLQCIREWRATYDKKTSKHHYRTCPICRKNSYLVIPSYYMVNSGPEKDALIEEFLNSNADKTICTFFMQGNCKYADRCKFLHPTGPPDYNHLSE